MRFSVFSFFLKSYHVTYTCVENYITKQKKEFFEREKLMNTHTRSR